MYLGLNQTLQFHRRMAMDQLRVLEPLVPPRGLSHLPLVFLETLGYTHSESAQATILLLLESSLWFPRVRT